jgi:hypothetical protein
MKSIIRASIKFISIDICERVLSYSILKNIFSNLKSVKRFNKREDLWEYYIESNINIEIKKTWLLNLGSIKDTC